MFTTDQLALSLKSKIYQRKDFFPNYIEFAKNQKNWEFFLVPKILQRENLLLTLIPIVEEKCIGINRKIPASLS